MDELAVKKVKAGALLLLALAGVVYAYQYKRSIDKTFPNKTFTVDGMGEIDSTPDVATFSATVVSEGGQNVSAVQKTNTDKMNAVNEFLKKQGIDKKDLKTGQYSVSPRYNSTPCVAGSCPPPSIVGYTVTQTLEVKVRNTEKVGDLLAGVVTSGANTVSEIRFVMDDEDAAKAEARAEAIDKAKAKAEAIAKAAGFRVGSLISLYEMSDPVQPFGIGGGGEMALKVNLASPVIEPGTQATKVQVNLTYEILP